MYEYSRRNNPYIKNIYISLMLDLYLEDVIPKSLFVCVCLQLYDGALGS